MRLPNLYLLNLTLLVIHEIDSAFWREWELFDLPGGIQLFLLINLGLVFAFLLGYRAIILALGTAAFWSWLLVAAGAIAVVVHAVFLALGNPAFRSAASILVLAVWGVLSLLEAIATAAAAGAKVTSRA